MPPGPVSTRALGLGRRAFPWLAGAAALLLRPSALVLTDPAACPGLVEFIAIGSFVFAPHVGAGLLFGILGAIAIAGATTGFLMLVARTTGSLTIATAAALAVALSPLFPATFTVPLAAGTFAACVALALLMERLSRPERQVSRRLVVSMSAALLIAALIVPPWTAIAATAAAWFAWMALADQGAAKRAAAAMAAAAGIVAPVAAMLAFSPPDALTGAASWGGSAACMIPRPLISPERALELMRAAAWALGPVVLTLAGLGALAVVGRWRPRHLPIAGIAAMGAGAVMVGGVAAPIACIPLVVAAWWLAAHGLQETIAVVGRGRPARAAAAAVLTLLPVLQAARTRGEERDDRVFASGHEQMSLQRVRGLLNIVVDGAAIVREDASIDLLLRAAMVSGPPGMKQFVVMPREADVIERAFAAGPTYAFPRGQLELGHRGFVLEPVAAASRRPDGTWEGIGGLEAIAGRKPCHLMQSDWVDVSDVAATGRIAVVAESEASFGPVVVLLAGSKPPGLVPEGWSLRMGRGFQWAVFDRRTEERTKRLMAEGQALGVPAEHPVVADAVLVRLALHRIPRGPLALPVTLGGSFPVAIARLDPTAASERLHVCDASGAHVTAFTIGESDAPLP